VPEERAFSSEEVIDLLHKVELFVGLPEEELERIAGIVSGWSAEADEVLFEEGEPGDVFYMVASGAIEIVKNTGGGHEEKLAVRRGGEAFGEMALLNDAPRSATARSQGASELLTISRNDFQAMLGGDSLALRMMQVLSKALRSLGVRFAAVERGGGVAAAASGGPSMEDVNRAFQRALLPSSTPKIDGFDVAAGTMLEDAGGGATIWEVLTFADGTTGLVSLAVEGQGLPPAHHLALARAFLRERASRASSPDGILQGVNDVLSRQGVPGVEQFIACAILAPRPEGLVWSSAGGTQGGVLRRDGTFDEFSSHGPPLGMMDGFRYGTQTLAIGAGDMVVVLSHGSAGLFRGAADLVSSLQQKPAGEVVSTVHEAIRRAQGDSAEETTVLFMRKH
jgi:CRP-like cAMP-binding protein